MRSLRILSVLAMAIFALYGCSNSGSNPVLPPLSAVTLNIHSDSVKVNGSIQFTATAYDLSSHPVPGATFAWNTSDASVFTVTNTGRVTGKGEGTAWLYAATGGLIDSASVLVLPATGGWFVQTSNSTAQLNSVFFQSDARNGCAVGSAGEILTTGDAGTTWTRRVSNTSFNLNSVKFVSATEGWAVGGNGTAVHTTDAGVTWAVVLTGASENLIDVCFATPDTGWAVGANGVIIRSFDHGGTWSIVHPTANTLNGVSFAGTLDGWAVGNGGVVLGTHDRGDTWFIVQPSLTTQPLRRVWRRSEPMAVAVGAAGTVLRSYAGADSTTWELDNAGAANSLEGVMFLTSTHGWAVGANGTGIVLETLDGGVTWQPQTAPAANPLRGVYFVDALRGWVVGDNGRILHTGTGGQ
ncbi:MAG TPA: YCF48-related protein [Candidatus Sulfotelmatobacter sp.]|nr:YCF48-related protein [Candidatus Sulfotelmatobacter sp.]